VKPAGNRDLTGPGESDWAGFCDINRRRHFRYRLKCKAHGPAMVEYECSDPWGAETMDRLRTTLDLKRPIEVRLHSLEAR
jgi:hypothetical protein